MLNKLCSAACVASLVMASLSNVAAAQQSSVKDQIVGAWNVISQITTLKSGKKISGYGEKTTQGINVFTKDGYFVVVVNRTDLPKLASPTRSKATAEEAKTIVAGSIAYFGKYRIDETKKEIIYDKMGGTFPNLPDKMKRIIVRISSDELIYRNPATPSGAQIEITAKRAK